MSLPFGKSEQALPPPFGILGVVVVNADEHALDVSKASPSRGAARATATPQLNFDGCHRLR